MGKEDSSRTTQHEPGADVKVAQSTNDPKQVDTYVTEKGASEHLHVATDKETGKEIGQWWQPNSKKK